jgi:hypothetical protein
MERATEQDLENASEAIREAEDAYDIALTNQMVEKFPELEENPKLAKPKLTNKDIIKAIINVIGSDFVHQDPREDGIGNNYLSYTDIEKLDVLYFKQISKRVVLSQNKYDECVDKIKSLDLPIDTVNIVKYSYLGKFIEVQLLKYHLRLVNKYKEFIEFRKKESVINRVDQIYNYLNSTDCVPREFIEWDEFTC